MPKKKSDKDACMDRKISKVYKEQSGKPKKQRIAIALSVARKHCEVKKKS